MLAGLAFGVPTAQALTARFDFSRDLGAEILDPVVLPNRAYVLDIVRSQVRRQHCGSACSPARGIVVS